MEARLSRTIYLWKLFFQAFPSAVRINLFDVRVARWLGACASAAGGYPRRSMDTEGKRMQGRWLRSRVRRSNAVERRHQGSRGQGAAGFVCTPPFLFQGAPESCTFGRPPSPSTSEHPSQQQHHWVALERGYPSANVDSRLFCADGRKAEGGSSDEGSSSGRLPRIPPFPIQTAPASQPHEQSPHAIE